MIKTKIAEHNKIARIVILLSKYSRNKDVITYADRMFVLFNKNHYTSLCTYKPY